MKNYTSQEVLINEVGLDILSQFEVVGAMCECDIFRTLEVVVFTFEGAGGM